MINQVKVDDGKIVDKMIKENLSCESKILNKNSAQFH